METDDIHSTMVEDVTNNENALSLNSVIKSENEFCSILSPQFFVCLPWCQYLWTVTVTS